MKTSKQRATISAVSLCKLSDGRYIMTGHVTDHPRQAEFKDRYQRTSRLISIDFEKGEAETLNTIYTLK